MEFPSSSHPSMPPVINSVVKKAGKKDFFTIDLFNEPSYIDTPGEYRQVGENETFSYVQLQSWVYKKLIERFPDIFIIPEHSAQAERGFTGDYMELDLGGLGTKPDDRRLFPQAASVINVADGDFAKNRNRLYQAVAEGDIIMCHGWWWSKRTNEVFELYQEAKSKGIVLTNSTLFSQQISENPAQKKMNDNQIWLPGISEKNLFENRNFTRYLINGRKGLVQSEQ